MAKQTRSRGRMSLERRRSLSGYVFTAPWIVGFLIFMVFPLCMNLAMSFGEIYDVVGLKLHFVGLDNYVRLFRTDVEFIPAFWATMKTTFLWSPFLLVFALFLALLLNRKLPFRGLFRVIFFLPVLLGTGYIMQQVGAAANILKMPSHVQAMVQSVLNADAADFINELLTQMMRMLWQTGVQVLIFLSGLQGIPDSYYEAAMIDNGNAWDCFWKITLPMLSPVILFNLIFTIVESFRSTDNEVAALIVNMVFTTADYEYGAAMGWVYLAVTALVVALIFWIARRSVIYEK